MQRSGQRIGACVAAVALLLGLSSTAGFGSGPAEARPARAGNSDLETYETQFPAESISRGPCEIDKGRVFIAHDLGSECVAYYIVGGAKARGTVFFFDGDVPPETARQPKLVSGYLSSVRAYMTNRAAAHGVRYVYVARIGVFGTSGNHARRKTSHEVETTSLAVDAIKARLGVERITLAGQSGGSMVAAGLMALGRNDVGCAVLASGIYDMPGLVSRALVRQGMTDPDRLQEFVESTRSQYFDVVARLPHIARSTDRRIFVLGDPNDERTPFDMQRQFASAVKSAGHHVTVIEVRARDKEHHALTAQAIDAAGRCAKGESEASLQRGLR